MLGGRSFLLLYCRFLFAVVSYSFAVGLMYFVGRYLHFAEGLMYFAGRLLYFVDDIM